MALGDRREELKLGHLNYFATGAGYVKLRLQNPSPAPGAGRVPGGHLAPPLPMQDQPRASLTRLCLATDQDCLWGELS